MVEEKRKKWDSQSGGSNFTTPGSEGLLVIEKNDKPMGVTRPQLEIRVYKENKQGNSSPRNWFTCDIRQSKIACRTKQVGLGSAPKLIPTTTVLNERRQRYLCKVSLY